jgi:hypothetical protein
MDWCGSAKDWLEGTSGAERERNTRGKKEQEANRSRSTTLDKSPFPAQVHRKRKSL